MANEHNHAQPRTTTALASSLETVEVSDALDFVKTNHRAVLATTRSDGTPQLSLVVAGVDDAGKIVISTREAALKTKNLLSRPSASLIVFTEAFYGDWVQLDGTIEVVHLPEAMDGLVSYYRSLSGDHPDWDEYRRSMTEQRRVLLKMTVERAGPDRSG
jgi:PPOX class probable F420-dependent enzyme